MACRAEFESKDGLRIYLENATEEDAHQAIGEVLIRARYFNKKHKPTSARMYRMFDMGIKIYETRFGEEWLPF